MLKFHMNYINNLKEEFNNPALIDKLQKSICETAERLDDVKIMEVCGSHTMAIAKWNLKNLLPKNVHLLSGPGCPVCVTSNLIIDRIIEMSKIPNVIIATFGDMMRVPGTQSNLIEQRAKRNNIKIVFSQLDALKIAIENPNYQVIFLGIGFETTTPGTAIAIWQACKKNVKNFSVYCAHKNMPYALKYLAKDEQINIDGLILPGHVSTIIGTKPYHFLAEKYKLPGVITGFDPVDIMYCIHSILKLIEQKEKSNSTKILNLYTRCVNDDGNKTAVKAINDVFYTCDCTWRGLGNIKNSGFAIKEQYKRFDAESKFKVDTSYSTENTACKCGDVLKGLITPHDCPLFAKVCSPQNPVGPCMVSSEGSCGIFYKHRSL